MPESVPVRCPACRRLHRYSAPSYPCGCGAPVAPPLDPGAAPVVVTDRVWEQDWIAVRCGSCGRRDQWPRPELGCPCGTSLRIPVAGEGAPADSGADGTGAAAPGRAGADGGAPAPPGPPPSGAPRPAFQPVTIRTARDAVTAAALYLRWLGYQDIRRADQRPPSGIGLAARGLLAQVDPTVRPASPRDVECLWLTAMTESADCVYFSLAGYAEDARDRADALGVPLFVLDLTGTPQPVNGLADELGTPDA
ncbi:hypothetical protein [Streptomyces sp. NPDC101249]|uniref:hypothetical protein n=1 Tax=Streptomyces sp. NPDC101249 TaxID=3366140 RepID=UPI00381AA175